MKRRSFFKGFMGLVGLGASGFLLKDVPAESIASNGEAPIFNILRLHQNKPKAAWIKDVHRKWIDVSGFDMAGVDEIVTELGRFKHLGVLGLPYLWVESDKYIMKKYKDFGVWKLVEGEGKQYLHYQYHVEKLN